MKNTRTPLPRFISHSALLSCTTVAATSTFSAEAQISFSGAVDYPAIGDMVEAHPIHLNGDSLHDIVALDDFGDLSFYINEGDGVFSFRNALVFDHAEGYDLDVGDIDNNGSDDVVWVSKIDHDYFGISAAMAIFDAYNTNATPVQLAPLGNYDTGVKAGDLDDDGDLDMVVVGHTKVKVFENNGGRSFSQTQELDAAHVTYVEGAEFGDLDDDGDNDFACLVTVFYSGYYHKVSRNQLFVFLNDDGTGTLSEGILHDLPTGVNHEQTVRSMTVDDLDNDGMLEITVGIGRISQNEKLQVAFLDNLGGGQFEVITHLMDVLVGSNTYLDGADVDADGDVDLIMGVSGPALRVYENNGGFDNFTVHEFPIHSSQWANIVAELNGDGRWDVLAWHDEGISMVFNETPLPGPMLEVSELERGEQAELNIANATPNKPVYFLASPNAIGSSVALPILNDMTLDLNLPIQLLKTRVADANGRVHLIVPVPSHAPRGTYAFQVISPAQQGGGVFVKSNFAQRHLVK